jgi:hypothetical protein
MDNVVIIDDVLPKQNQISIENIFNDNIPWLYNEKCVTDNTYALFREYPDIINHPQLVHTFFNEALKDQSQHLIKLLPLISCLPTFIHLSRIKANLTYPVISVTDTQYGVPHVDYPNTDMDNFVTGIYYVNDSDGDAVIFNEFNENPPGTTLPLALNKPLTIKQRIEPKQGRLVLFDGRRIHAGNIPRTSNHRIVINFNILVKKNPS